jgi:hypothetical protein
MTTITVRLARLASTAAIVGALGVTAACGRGNDAGLLPDEDTLAMPLPNDAEGRSRQAQAICASDTEAYDELVARVEIYNEALAGRIALLRALQRSAARSLERTGAFEYTATAGASSATLLAEEDDEGAVTYTVTLTGPDGEARTLMEGNANADRTAGAWTVFVGSARTVDVTWSSVDETLTVERVARGAVVERTATMVRTPETVTIDFVGPNHVATATWDRATKDGRIVIEEAAHCFDVDPENVDVCSVPCDDA